MIDNKIPCQSKNLVAAETNLIRKMLEENVKC